MSRIYDILIFLAGFFISAAFLFLSGFLKSYFKKKGENAATIEDMEIIMLQEGIKHEFTKPLELSKQRHSMRMVVAAERMAAHQQAFVYLKKLLSCRDDTSIITACKEWADQHCLYLSPEARQAFWRAIGSAEACAWRITEANKHGYDPNYARDNDDRIQQSWLEIEGAFQAIVQGAELPPLVEPELKELQKSLNQSRASNPIDTPVE